MRDDNVEEKDNEITLTAKQVGLILAIITSLIGGVPLVANKLSPQVRSDPFTGQDGARLEAYCNRELAELSARLAELEQWRHDHTEWGNRVNVETQRWRGKIDAEHTEFHRLLRP